MEQLLSLLKTIPEYPSMLQGAKNGESFTNAQIRSWLSNEEEQ